MSEEKGLPFNETMIRKLVQRAGDSNTAAAILFGVSRKNNLHGAALKEAENWRTYMHGKLEERVRRFNAGRPVDGRVLLHDVLVGTARIGALSDWEKLYLDGFRQRQAQAHKVEPDQPSKRF